MPETAGTFSESWYRIADQHAALRPHVTVRRQFYRGERWYVLRDPMNNQFFRLRPAAYDFVARLRLDSTIEQAWKACLDANPNEAPGQEDVIRLLAQLYSANLLHSDLPPDSAKLFDRFKQRRQKEIRSRLLNIMFARFPLLDPDEFLKRIMPLIKTLFSWFGAVVWLVVVGFAVKLALDNWDGLKKQTEGVLAPDNLFLLYAGFILTKTVHEFGHAFACRRFGGEVHTMGIMLMIFTPVPYVDATSSWSFRSRWQRILVGGAGMITELFLAAIAMFVWAKTGEGTLHSLAYNMVFVSSISTLIFNLNPLMRFDGYYMLSDLLDIPNLQMRAGRQLAHLVERYAFGRKKSESPTQSRKEAWWLAVFGIASYAYRIVVFAGILLFLADRLLILGIIMAAICAVSWVVVPIGKFIHYLATSPRLDRTRPRAIAVSTAFAAVLVLLLDVIPFPNNFRAPGVLEAVEHTVVANEAPGYIDKVLATSGAGVVRGQPLIQMRDPELEFEIAAVRAQHAEAQAMELRAMQQQTADLMPIRSRLAAISKRSRRLQQEEAALTVRAKHDGRWIAPEIDDLRGVWVPRGTSIGMVINSNTFYFSAVVAQKEASRLFTKDEIRGKEVRLRGQAGIVLPVSTLTIIPAEHQTLPSAALGWRGGGDIAVSLDDPSGVRATEPFFELRATIQPNGDAAILHGRSGRIRFELEPRPLLQQWFRKLRQLIQQRYGI
jgi:putative peptide zinc metalloprotease protein